MSNIKKIKQADINPFPNSDTNKRYYTYDYWLKRTFGGKCMKLPLDAGFTCPNRDGRVGRGGCTYCDNAAFHPSYSTAGKSLHQQLDEGIEFHKNDAITAKSGAESKDGGNS